MITAVGFKTMQWGLGLITGFIFTKVVIIILECIREGPNREM